MNDSAFVAALDPPRAYRELAASASIRTRPEDFRVDEELGFEPAGTGEHLYLQVRKRRANTRWVAARLADHFSVKRMDVGYAGLKDRHALTTQWFSVRDPSRSATAATVAIPDVEVLREQRHVSKLRPGAHFGNSFELTLRDVTFEAQLRARLKTVASTGVPNYFGPQRFGRDGRTLERGMSWLSGGRPRIGRFERGLYLSAARAWLFNRVLAMRVGNRHWLTPLAGDVLEDGAPTGPLWGRGRSPARCRAAALEEAALMDASEIRDGLEHAGLVQERRPLALVPRNLRYERLDDTVFALRFELPPGSFATALLHELGRVYEPRRQDSA